MLDISIRDLSQIKLESQKKLADKKVTITEKFDGTKLTLIRNDVDFDASDYSKNWIIAYKNNIISKEEFSHAPPIEQIKHESLGSLQYALIHAWLKSCHLETLHFPKSTEFFLEFIQKKPTLLCEYQRLHDVFLIGAASTKFFCKDLHVVSYPDEMITDRSTLTYYAVSLDIRLPPVIFSGKLKDLNHTAQNCQKYFDKEVTFDLAKLNVAEQFAELNRIFSRINSSLQGQAEGAVLDFGQGNVFKLQRHDQTQSNVRHDHKMKMLGRTDAENATYWIDLHKSVNANSFVHCISPLAETLEKISAFSSKQNVREHEDFLLTSKLLSVRRLILGYRWQHLNTRYKKIAFIPMAAKPFHAGHDTLIKKALNWADHVVCIVSHKDRIRKGEFSISGLKMMQVWHKYLLPHYDYNCANIEFVFSESPIRDMMRLIKESCCDELFEETAFKIVSDADDEFDQETLQKEFPNEFITGKIGTLTCLRSETVDISGTKMRFFLGIGHKKEFTDHLPDFLTETQRINVWKELSQ